MLAIQAREAGGPEVLEAVDIPRPTPKTGEILIRQEAIGLNFIDTYQRSGLYPVRLPAVLGLEGAGVVEAVGEGVTRFKVGDRAAYAGRPGAYAEAHAVPEDRAVKIPPGVTTQEAGAGLLRGMTAEFLLRRCYPVKSGETILVHAAAGGVGSILAQWAQALGAVVIGAVGSIEKANLAKSYGCDHVILYREEIVAEKVREITGGAGVAVAYDGVGKDTFDGTLASLARRGMFVSFGNASGPAAPVDPQRLARGGSLFLTRPTLFDYIATTADLDDSAGALFSMIETGKVKIEIGQSFPLAETRRAHEALESRQTHGATVLIP
jgi:NADPH2:quinone reductase